MSAVLELTDITRRYRSLTALQSVSVSLEAGTIYGLLGPNGAGKTTLLSIAAGLLAPDAGTVCVAGCTMAGAELAAKRRLGFLPDTPNLYDHLTAAEMLDVAGLLFGVPRAQRAARAVRLLERLGLQDRANSLVETYSHGMRKRLALACSLIHQPELLLLDEPTNGLDLEQTRIARDILLEHAAAGGAVLLSTHRVDLVARICHRVGILARGRLLAEGTPKELCLRHDTSDLEEMYFQVLAGADEHK